MILELQGEIFQAEETAWETRTKEIQMFFLGFLGRRRANVKAQCVCHTEERDMELGEMGFCDYTQ